MNARSALVRTLEAIEAGVEENLTVEQLARAAYLSGSHLQRLFSLSVGQPLMAYVRARKLTCSLDDLLGTQPRVIEIAHRYGFGHEQSYIRAFRKQFGCTPGAARERRPILPVRERIDPGSLSSIGQGLLAGPDVVMVPSFSIIGRPHLFGGFDDVRDAGRPNQIAMRFVAEDVARIPNLATPPTYIGLNTVVDPVRSDIEYLASAQVTRTDCVPHGLESRVVPTRMCLLFRYVGEHRVTEITMATAHRLYDAIERYFAEQRRYRIEENWFFERIDSSRQDDSCCLMEWLRPVADA